MRLCEGVRLRAHRMRITTVMMNCLAAFALSIAQQTEKPEAVPEDCLVDVVIASVGQPITLLFEPTLQLSNGEQPNYRTLSGSFIATGLSQITWIPTCIGWDFIEIRATDAQGSSRVVLRIDFIVDDVSRLLEVYDLPVDAEGRGYLVPLTVGGCQYAAILRNDMTSQAPGRPGQGGRLCLKRPDPPPGLNCASLPPEGIWVCPPFYIAHTYCGSLRTCAFSANTTVATICGSAAASLRARIGLPLGRCIIIGDFKFCADMSGCVTISTVTATRVRCQSCTIIKKQYCRRFCCINGVVQCCEQHLYIQKCHEMTWWFPPPAGPTTHQTCHPPEGPFTQPGCDW